MTWVEKLEIVLAAILLLWVTVRIGPYLIRPIGQPRRPEDQEPDEGHTEGCNSGWRR
jgi:hypothetical protein